MMEGRDASTNRRLGMRGFIELLHELAYYLAHNKRWWLTPIVVVLVVLSLLMALIASPLGPAFYAIF
jgi:hypothetical protein